MIEVKIPADIQEYKSKLIAGLSTRQFISVAAALVVGTPIGAFGYGKISGEVLPWIVILVTAPILAWGFIRILGMPFEEFAMRWAEMTLLPQRRMYEDTEENLFSHLHEEIMEEKLAQERIEYEEME